jgi:hypothetical protein
MSTTTTIEPGLTRAQLVQIVRTGTPIKGVAKMRALAALGRRERKDVGDVFLELVANREELPRFRHMAAVGLYQMGGTRGREALVAAARDADASTAPAIAVGLGRIGAADNLATVERLAEMVPAHARDRVTFAATLLAYRHGLEDHEVRAPAKTTLQELGGEQAHSVEIGRARADDARRALEALAAEPLDVDLTTERALRIDCEPNTFVWLWAEDAARNGFTPLAERKGVAGALFRRNHFENAYAVAAIGLGTPMRGGSRLTLHRPETGAILYSGPVSTDGSLDLQARSRPGVPAVEIRLQVAAGAVEVAVARSAVRSRQTRAPRRS